MAKLSVCSPGGSGGTSACQSQPPAERIRERVQFPPGYYIQWAGQFEYLQAAEQGMPEAQVALGDVYTMGVGVAADGQRRVAAVCFERFHDGFCERMLAMPLHGRRERQRV